jgi:hypothetical protein
MCPNGTLSTSNPTLLDLGSGLGHRDWKNVPEYILKHLGITIAPTHMKPHIMKGTCVRPLTPKLENPQLRN